MTKYANLIRYSDVEPFEIIATSKSGKQITIREMDATIDPDFKPEFHAGGFSAHCSNQHEQRWTYKSNENLPTIKAHLRKDGKYYSAYGKHAIQAEPRRFHDYNF